MYLHILTHSPRPSHPHPLPLTYPDPHTPQHPPPPPLTHPTPLHTPPLYTLHPLTPPHLHPPTPLPHPSHPSPPLTPPTPLPPPYTPPHPSHPPYPPSHPVQVGDAVYAKVVKTDRHVHTELSCLSETVGRNGIYGKLDAPGVMYRGHVNYIRRSTLLLCLIYICYF